MEQSLSPRKGCWADACYGVDEPWSTGYGKEPAAQGGHSVCRFLQAMIRSDYGTAVAVSGGSALFARGSDKTLLTQSHLGEERITVHIWNKPRQEPERSTDYWLMIRLLSHKAQVHLSRDDTAHMIHNQDNLPQAWSQARVIWAIPLLKLPQMIRGHVKLAAEGS